MFNNLSDKLDKAFHILKGHGKITEVNVADTLKEVRRALLDADVNFKIAKDFTTRVKEKAIGQDVLTTLQPGQLMVKLVKDELTELMGGDAAGINLSGNPTVILMSGLQGSGKTTFSGKLANYLKTKKNKKPLLVACDIYRPAAINQLHVVGDQIGVEVYSEPENKNPVDISQKAITYAKSNGFNVVIVDTAGRLAVDEEMMTEIANVHKAIQPQETLFVVDAMTGQDAVNTAKAFNDRLNFDGVILTKLDGDTRGGAAITIKSVVNKPIKFVGTGEKMDDDIVNFVYPITIKYQNFTTQVLNNSDDLDNVLDNCGEDDGFDEIDCISINYPIIITVYDTNNQIANTITIVSNAQLFNYIATLTPQTISTIVYPISVTNSSGQSVVINSNNELESFIDSSIDDCDDSSVPSPTFTSVLTSGTWHVSYFSEDGDDKTTDYLGYDFTFNPNWSIQIVNSGNTSSGTWTNYMDSGENKLNLTFSNTYLAELVEDWSILEYNQTVIRLKNISGGDGSIDYLYFTKN